MSSLYRNLQWPSSSWPIGLFIQLEAVCVFVDGVKIQIVKQQPLLGSKRMLSVAFKWTLELKIVKETSKPPARMRDVRAGTPTEIWLPETEPHMAE
jgi:hypothetical protein